MRAGRRCVQPDSVAVSSDSPVAASGAWGTISALSFAFGASTPWFAQRGVRSLREAKIRRHQTDQVQSPWDERRQALHELQRRQARCAWCRHARQVFSLSTTCPALLI